MGHLAERRTDIFGVGEEAAQEAAIGKKMGEEETRRSAEPEKVTWDGHSSSAEAAARAARVNISLNDQIEQIHRNKGLIPDSSKENVGPKAPHSAPHGAPHGVPHGAPHSAPHSAPQHSQPQMAPPPPVTVVSMQPPQPVPVPQPQPVAIMQMRPPPHAANGNGRTTRQK